MDFKKTKITSLLQSLKLDYIEKSSLCTPKLQIEDEKGY